MIQIYINAASCLFLSKNFKSCSPDYHELFLIDDKPLFLFPFSLLLVFNNSLVLLLEPFGSFIEFDSPFEFGYLFTRVFVCLFECPDLHDFYFYANSLLVKIWMKSKIDEIRNHSAVKFSCIYKSCLYILHNYNNSFNYIFRRLYIRAI